MHCLPLGIKTPQRSLTTSPHTEPLAPRLGKEGRERNGKPPACERPAARVVLRERLFPGVGSQVSPRVGASRCLRRNTRNPAPGRDLGPRATRRLHAPECARARPFARGRPRALGSRAGSSGSERRLRAGSLEAPRLSVSPRLGLCPLVAPAGARPDSPPGSGTGPWARVRAAQLRGPHPAEWPSAAPNALSPRDVRGRRREASRSRDVAGPRVSGLLTGSGSPLAGTPARSLLGVCCGRDARRFFFQSLDGRGGTAATAAPTRAKWRQLRRLLELSPVCAGAEASGRCASAPGCPGDGAEGWFSLADEPGVGGAQRKCLLATA